MTHKEYRTHILALLTSSGHEAVDAGRKGDGLFIRGMGFVSTAKAAKIVGAPPYIPEPREPTLEIPAWGDYATIVTLNRGRK